MHIALVAWAQERDGRAYLVLYRRIVWSYKDETQSSCLQEACSLVEEIGLCLTVQ